MDTLSLLSITPDVNKSDPLFSDPDCQSLFQHYPAYYNKVGYKPPWIGYFILREGTVVGCCGFVSGPVDHLVEIAYGTFKQFERQGIASFACQSLVAITKKTDASLTITAKTLMENNASVRLLKRNGFVHRGNVIDDDEGEVWEWLYEG